MRAFSRRRSSQAEQPSELSRKARHSALVIGSLPLERLRLTECKTSANTKFLKIKDKSGFCRRESREFREFRDRRSEFLGLLGGEPFAEFEPLFVDF